METYRFTRKTLIMIVIVVVMILLTFYLDGINVLTEIDVNKSREFSIYNINIWELTSFYGVLIAVLSFVWAIYVGIKNLNEIINNDYQRTKAKLILELKQVGKVKILVFRNSGDTPAKIKDINWSPELIRADFITKGYEKNFLNYDKPLFSSKLNKNLFPLEEIKYYISGENINIYEKLERNKEFSVTVKWEDYKGNENVYEYILDFNNETIEHGGTKINSTDIYKKVDQLQDNLVQAIKEHAFETKQK